MKKLTAIIMTIAFVMSIITIPVLANQITPVQDDVVFEIETIEAEPGTDIAVSLNLNGEYESNALTVFVRFDPEKLQLTTAGLTKGDVWKDIILNDGMVQTNTNASDNIGFMAIMPSGSFSGSGTLFTMNFHVLESVEPGTTIPVELDVDQFTYDEVGGTINYIPFSTVNGAVIIPGEMPLPEFSATIEIPSVSVNAGESIDIPVTITGEYLAHALAMHLSYDAEILTINSVTAGNIISDATMIVLDYENTPGIINLGLLYVSEPMNANGTLFTVNATVNEEYHGDTTLEAEILDLAYNPDGGERLDIPYTVVNGSIHSDVCHTVTFVDWDGTVLDVQTVEHGSHAIPPELLEREGYTFTGWDVPIDNVTSDLTVTAQYEINSYTITYTVNGEEYLTLTYEYGATIDAPAYLVPEGYTFSGWGTPETMPAADIAIDASLVINTYIITFVDGVTDEIILTMNVEHNSDAQLPEAPLHEGYVFNCWVGDSTNVTEDRTIIAEYWMVGDADCDGEMTVADAMVVLRYALGMIDADNQVIMDFTGEGAVDTIDALMILRFCMRVTE